MESFRGEGRAGSWSAEAGQFQEGKRRYQRACELEGSEGQKGWSQITEGKIQAVGESSGRNTGGKTTCFSCLSFYCQMSYSSSWKRIQGEDDLCFLASSIPSTVPRFPRAWGLPPEGQRGQAASPASCLLPGPHLRSEGREGRSIGSWAFVEPRRVCAPS